jgi:hypothetical protein
MARPAMRSLDLPQGPWLNVRSLLAADSLS